MPAKKRFLKSVTVNFISLVDKGANNKTIIYKSAETDSMDGDAYNKTISISKYDEDQHMVYGIVYSPNEVDSDGDFTDAEVIKQMAYEFMKNRNTGNVDRQHDSQPDEGFVAESWLLEKNDSRFPEEPEGSWAVGIKVTNEDTWAKVLSGEITGLSMGGIAVVEEVQKDKAGILSILKTIAGTIRQGFSTMDPELCEDELQLELKNLTESVDKTINDNTVIDKHHTQIQELETSVKELKNLFELRSGEIEKRLQVVEQSGCGSIQGIILEDVNKQKISYKGPNWLS